MIIQVKAHTRARKQQIIIKDDIYHAYLHNIPKNNEANSELIDLLSNYFKVSKSCILIIRGLKSSDKVLKIDQ